MVKYSYFLHLLIFCLLSVNFLMAQESIPFDKDAFPDQKKELRDAKKNIRQGDRLFESGEGLYPKAADHYLQAYNFNSENALLNYKIGLCYFETNKKDKAGKYLIKAHQLDSSVKPDIKYVLGKYYQYAEQFSKALDLFEEFRKTLTPKELKEKGKAVDKRIAECKIANEITSNPRRVFVDNLGKQVNSPYQDYSPILDADENMLYFTSRRPSEDNSEMKENEFGYKENIYIREKDAEGNFAGIKKPGKKLSTDNHEGIVCMSPDGNQMILYRATGGGDLYLSERENEGWNKPKGLSKKINTESHESYAAFSPDGDKLFYVSDKAGGYGKHDIYVSQKDEKGRWTEGKNLGASVNTPLDEASVFMHSDGKTLYFSSKGHKAMGGYDLFKAELQNGEWTKPENLGYPINTAGDEVFITVLKDNKYAYLSSERAGGYGCQDIYKITFLGESKNVVNSKKHKLLAFQNVPVETEIEGKVAIEEIQLVTMKGRITDKKTEEPLEARVVLTDNNKNEDITSFKSNPETGKYVISLPLGKNYGISVMAEGYLFYSKNIDLTDKDKNYEEIKNDIALNKIEIGSRIVLRNIFFDSGKSELRESSRSELDRLYDIMKENPAIRVEISGHTDNVGSASYNEKLSQERAKSVVDYLVDKGIDKDRLEFKGYGFRKPIADNDTEEGRQQNRRTEFEIISDK
ncbi:MAG: OmpA family protein [Bacteroidales bacterium]|nr:OmpA family protein [Bacteroidales bacterium]MCF8327029.1 OmpA family protein [Bacteroidales bacterium]